MNEDQQLIDDVRIAYGAKDLKELCSMSEIDLSYVTLTKWNSGEIPKSGTGKQYLQSLIKIKQLEKDQEMYKNFFDSFNAIINHQNDK